MTWAIFALISVFTAQAETSSVFNQAMQASKKKDYRRALLLWKTLTKSQPKKALYWFNRGNCELLLKKPGPAAISYQKVIQLNSRLKPAAKLYQVKAYRQMGNTKKAINKLTSLRQLKLPPYLTLEVELEWSYLKKPSLRKPLKAYFNRQYKDVLATKLSGERGLHLKAVAELQSGKTDRAISSLESAIKASGDPVLRGHLFQLKQGIKSGVDVGRKRISIGFQSAIGYDTNVGREASAANAVQSALWEFGLNLGYHIWKHSKASAAIRYSAIWEEVWEQASFRYIGQSVSGELTYTPHQGSQASIGPVVRFDILGTDSLQYQAGGQLTISQQFGKSRVGFYTDLYGNSAASSTYSYLSGMQHESRMQWQMDLKRWQFLAAYRYNIQDIGSLPLSAGTIPLGYAGHGPQINVAYRPSDRWQLGVRTELSAREYFDTEQPSGNMRNDLIATIAFVAARTFKSDLMAFAEIEYNNNRSSLDLASLINQSYSQFSTKFGVAWEIL